MTAKPNPQWVASFSERYNELTRDMTQREQADRLGIGITTAHSYANGLRSPKLPALYSIAKYFGVNPIWLAGGNAPKYAPETPSERLPTIDASPNHLHQIPVLGRVAAGLPLLAEELIEGYIYTDRNHGSAYFGLRVVGDSMNGAMIPDGAIVVVRQQDDLEDGEIGVIMVGDEDATIKRFYRSGTTATLMPQSNNPQHQPQVYDLTKTPIRVLGRVVEVRFDL